MLFGVGKVREKRVEGAKPGQQRGCFGRGDLKAEGRGGRWSYGGGKP